MSDLIAEVGQAQVRLRDTRDADELTATMVRLEELKERIQAATRTLEGGGPGMWGQVVVDCQG